MVIFSREFDRPEAPVDSTASDSSPAGARLGYLVDARDRRLFHSCLRSCCAASVDTCTPSRTEVRMGESQLSL
jgi:hypothetical protein